MNALTETVQIIRDAGGYPAFAVTPFADHQSLVKGKATLEPGIPAAVVNLAKTQTKKNSLSLKRLGQ